MNLWTSMVHEEEEQPPAVPREWPSLGSDISTAIIEEYLRHTDPVNCNSIRDWIGKYLNGFIRSCGGEQEFRSKWLINVDQKIIDGLRELGTI